MYRISIMIFAICLLIVGAKMASFYFFNDNDELYSHYRNIIDISRAHYKKWLLRKKIISLVILLSAIFAIAFSITSKALQ